MTTDYERGLAAGQAVARANSTAGIMFVIEAQSDAPRFDEITMLEHANYFTPWDEHYTGQRGSIVRREAGGVTYLYKALHDIGAGHSASKPEDTPTLWKRIGNPGDEWPMWSQPIAGVDSLYRIGDKVSHKGKHWVCQQENSSSGNSYEPGVWGWEEVKG